MSNTSNFGTELLPERPAVLKAWEGFRSTYPTYLEPSNRAAWLMQDKIVNDYATGVLMSEAEWRIGQGTEPLYVMCGDCRGNGDHDCKDPSWMTCLTCNGNGFVQVWPKGATDADA